MRVAFFLTSVLLASTADEIIRQSWEAERLFDEARYEAADRAYAAVVPLLVREFGEAHARTLIAINNRAAALLQLNRGPEAEAVLRDALNRRDRAQLAEDETLAATYNNLGEAFTLQEKFRAAGSVHERALAIRQRLLTPHDSAVAESLHNLGESLRRSGELTRAEKHLRAAVEIWKSHRTPATGAIQHPLMPGFAKTMNSLGMLYGAQANLPRAEQTFREAIEAAEATYGKAHEIPATLHYNFAAHFHGQRRWTEADRQCRQALGVYELLPGYNDPKFALMLELHAQILTHLAGRNREARGQRARARALLSLQ